MLTKRVVYYWNKDGVGKEPGSIPWRHTFWGKGECLDCGISQKELSKLMKANPSLFREGNITNASQ